jgi:lipoprotein-releasing system ATP-binding protein
VSREIVRARGLGRVLKDPMPVTLVTDIDLTVSTGEFVAVNGPSGSGKSSLLYLLGLLDRPSAGRVWLDGRDTSELDDHELAKLRLEKIGFVFQFHFLLPEFSALDNVLVPMRKRNVLNEADMRARAGQLLSDLGLGAQLHKRPDQLSGGERQRVAIARSMANDPLLILADEPTGNLDTANGRLVFEIFARLARERGKAVIAVTHELDLAALCFRRVHLVDGRIVADESVPSRALANG